MMMRQCCLWYTYFKKFSVGLFSIVGSLFTIGLGVGTLAIRRRNGPSGAVHSSRVILVQRILIREMVSPKTGKTWSEENLMRVIVNHAYSTYCQIVVSVSAAVSPTRQLLSIKLAIQHVARTAPPTHREMFSNRLAVHYSLLPCEINKSIYKLHTPNM